MFSQVAWCAALHSHSASQESSNYSDDMETSSSSDDDMGTVQTSSKGPFLESSDDDMDTVQASHKRPIFISDESDKDDIVRYFQLCHAWYRVM